MATSRSTTFQTSLVTVMRLAHAELRDLSKRQSTIRRRVSGLSRILADLQDDVRCSLSSNVSPDLLLTTHHRRPRRSRGDNSRVLLDPRRSAPDYRLRRACRLALLELDEPGSAENIRSRIMRRGAFHFVEPASAIDEVVRALDSMARDGEVRLVRHDSSQRWMRIVREETPTPQLLDIRRTASVDRIAGRDWHDASSGEDKAISRTNPQLNLPSEHSVIQPHS